MFFKSNCRRNFKHLFLSAAIMVNVASINAMSHTQYQVSASDTFITWTYNETPMGLFLPEKTDKPLPVVMFLHGCHNNPVNRYHWILSALNAIEPCAVFLPTAPETPNTQYSCADWGGTYDSELRPQMINALSVLDSLMDYYGFDAKRQYLYGESMGGEGVYRLLMDFPERFAGAVTAAGYTEDKGATEMAQTPLWIFIGENDEVSPVENSRKIHNSILEAGGSMVKYTEFPGLGHVAAIEKVREESDVPEWLLTQNRSPGNSKNADTRKKTVIPEELFNYAGGKLHFSSHIPVGTVITLFDLNGQMILRTGVQMRSIALPATVTGRVLVWNMSNSWYSVSGKMLFNRQ